jgi:hypothetical protein
MTPAPSQLSPLSAAWREAAADLGIRVVTPFAVQSGETTVTFPLHLPDFGGPAGMVCGTLDTPAAHALAAERAGYYCSRINAESYSRYQRDAFIATLDDWQYFGPPAQRPPWYASHPWRHASPPPR